MNTGHRGQLAIKLLIELWARLKSAHQFLYILYMLDFRYYIHQNYPIILEGYYTVGEELSGNDYQRTIDYKTWAEKRYEQ